MAICLSKIFDTEIGDVNITTDTRAIKAGDFFLPLKGANFDGHEYINEALEKGAIGAFCEKNKLDKVKAKDRVIQIKDSLETYHQIANYYRKEINPKLIAITGSSGKTTTKEMLRHITAEKFKTHYSHANFNNEVGVPKTILEMPADTEVLILEMGMRGLGEIALLSKTAEPDIALITNVGSAHLERLGSLENIKKAKLEITSGLKDKGLLAVSKDLYEKIEKEHGEIKERYTVKFFDDQANYQIKGLAGPAIHSDANAAALVAKELGIGMQEIITGLNKYEPGDGRGKFHEDKKGNIFIDDSYNANPDSVKASVDALMAQFPKDQKVFVIGKILESDPKLVKEIFDYIESLVAKESSRFLKLIRAEDRDIDEVSEELRKLTGRGERSVVLIKGSREARLEKVLQEFL